MLQQYKEDVVAATDSEGLFGDEQALSQRIESTKAHFQASQAMYSTVCDNVCVVLLSLGSLSAHSIQQPGHRLLLRPQAVRVRLFGDREYAGACERAGSRVVRRSVHRAEDQRDPVLSVLLRDEGEVLAGRLCGGFVSDGCGWFVVDGCGGVSDESEGRSCLCEGLHSHNQLHSHKQLHSCEGLHSHKGPPQTHIPLQRV